MPATMGYVGWIGTFEGHNDSAKEATTESEIAREVISLGAVPIGKVRH